MYSSKLRNVFFSALCVLMAACSTARQVDESAQFIPLGGTNWELVQLTVLGGFVFVPDDPGKYVLRFRSENRLNATSDCNTISGAWQQGATELRFEPFSTTTSLCVAGSLHNNLVLYLKDVTAYRFRDGHLVLTTPTQGIEIEFSSRD